MIDPELKAAFQSTHFCIDMPNDSEEIVMRVGQNCPALLRAFPNLEDWVYITAWNPMSKLLSPEENEKRNQSLKNDIQQLGFELHRGEGRAPDGSWAEEHFFIPAMSREQGLLLGRKYEQWAFLCGNGSNSPELVFCF
ncbi:DUF3293 domain-containing protein [Peijinzhouia sedimentorum]